MKQKAQGAQQQGQRQKQGQRLAMTPQLRQSIGLLAMSAAELDRFVADAAERNPCLRLRRPVPRAAMAALPDWTEHVARPETLADHLCAQIALAAAPAPVAALARAIAHDLDGKGRLPDPDALCRSLGARPAIFGRALALVRTLEPHGVGARDLADCLALQLRARDRLDPAMAIVVANLRLVARGEFAVLARLAGLSADELRDALEELRALDPRPGLRFDGMAARIDPPDVVVRPAPGGGWHVALNGDVLPRAVADRDYHAALRPGARGAAAPYLDDALREASWLVRALDQRARTLLAVAEALVRHQDAFLREGPAALRPLTLRTVAERIGVHESTVSRVTTNKTVLLPGGTFAMKHFFSTALPAANGDAHSARAVQARIRTLVDGEGERVLSDDQIVVRLQDEGVTVARRTVAKYRDGLGVPSSVERRRKLKRASAQGA